MLPSWIPYLVAVWVIAFGVMRIRIGLRKQSDDNDGGDKPNFRKGGYYARSSRSHLMYGVAYLALGGYCIAMGMGYHYDFVGACQAPKTTVTPSNTDGVPVDLN